MKIVPPRRANGRGRGTESSSSRRKGSVPRPGSLDLLLKLSPGASKTGMEEPLSTTLTIPAEVVQDVREGLFGLLGDAAEGIMHSLEQRDRDHHVESFKADRRQLGQVFALLDLVGWTTDSEPRAVAVDLGEHGQTLKEAVDGWLPLLEDQEAEVDVNDKRRAEEGKPPRKQEILGRLAACRVFAALLERRLKELA
jgi:hypothetical protein